MALGAGLVDDERASRLGEHLDRCDTCREVMETVHSLDPLEVVLRRQPEEGAVAIAASVAEPVIALEAEGVSLDRFTKQLIESGLFEADELQSLRQRFVPSKPTVGVQEFADSLIGEGRLTAYQAQTVLGGKGKTLTLGSYLLLDKLGQGGMGVVYRALHQRMKRVVALKVLSPRLNTRPDLVQRFQREMQAAARLSHPNVVRALDAEIAGTRRFLVMEFVAGDDLAQLVKQRGRMSVALALDCVLQAARGLDYAHQQGIVHRDVKPSNLLLSGDPSLLVPRKNETSFPTGGAGTSSNPVTSGSGVNLPPTVKILDLGLARMTGDLAAAELTSTGAVMGTIDYMAPEQATNTKHADARADVYSLGITLWFLLTGRVAYAGDSPMAKLLAHREGPIPSLRTLRSDVPGELDRAFRVMIEKRPEDRYPSMSAVITVLEHLQRNLSPELLAAAPFLPPDEGESLAIEIGGGMRVVIDGEESADGRPTEDDSQELDSLGHSTIAYQAAVSSDTAPTVITGASKPRTTDLTLKFSDSDKGVTRASQRLVTRIAAVGVLALVALGVIFRDRFVTKPTEVAKRTSVGGASTDEQSVSKTSPVDETDKPPEMAVVAQPAAVTSPPPTNPVTPTAAAALSERVAVLTQLLEGNPDNTQWLNERLGLYKRLGMWKWAAQDALRFCEVAPATNASSMLWMQVGYLSLLADDRLTYRHAVRELKSRYDDSESIDELERVCKSPLFVPGEFDIAEFPVAKFESLIHPEIPDTGGTYWACATRAYIASHAGEPQLALDWLQKRVPQRRFMHCFTYWTLVEAQSLHRLGRKEDAARSLATATEMIPPRLIQKVAGQSDHYAPLTAEEVHGDWLILEVLRQQTVSLLADN